MWWIGWQLGVERQQDMLREAEQWRQLGALLEPTEHRNYLHALRMGAGRILIVLGRLLAPDSSVPVSDVPVQLKTNL